ncbi:RNA 2',3'-cyclic phosphodiesterase [Dokdonella soli]|uniref:RNA 2',3'-cyclic phosphodiesterase n=1 Tax=Dokdonella soli TaxID=529810 RepID=A0ABP3TJH0_9GAMM
MQQSNLPGFDPPAREVHNLFFALWPDESTRQRIAHAAAGLQREQNPYGRWIKPARYHLTLQFLGEHASLQPKLIDRASAAAAQVRAAPFDLVLDSIGSFVNARIPCWLGCSEVPTGLQILFDALSETLRSNGCRITRATRLVPHVTILRDADRQVHAHLESAVRWRVDEFVLIDSQIQPFMPHRILGRWPLL